MFQLRTAPWGTPRAESPVGLAAAASEAAVTVTVDVSRSEEPVCPPDFAFTPRLKSESKSLFSVLA